jgi:hypothetical protein
MPGRKVRFLDEGSHLHDLSSFGRRGPSKRTSRQISRGVREAATHVSWSRWTWSIGLRPATAIEPFGGVASRDHRD